MTDLSLEKFGSIGGDYFEHLIAIALDELGYEENVSYVPSWANTCVPGTWIEADFIIGDKGGTDPTNNGRKVFAIGHATSENSAQMKFHRDVEQLLEVKALSNGDDFMVFDILFCCPRETMGGWSKELIDINEAIFDGSLVVWKHGWGQKLLWHFQELADDLKDGVSAQKKSRLNDLLDKIPEFRKEFEHLKAAVKSMLNQKKSSSKIQSMFALEQKSRAKRIDLPLLIKSKEKTEYKRGLLQVLALNEWELELLYENHQRNKSNVFPLEKLTVEEHEMPLEDFDEWWKRLELLSVKIGSCYEDFFGDNFLDPDEEEYRFFDASSSLAYVFDHFDLKALSEVVKNVPLVAPNLLPYLIDLNDLSRAELLCDLLKDADENEFIDLSRDCYLNDPWAGVAMPRLLTLEVAKAAIKTELKKYSYDVIASDSGDPGLIKNPFTMRFIAGKKGSIDSPIVEAGLCAVGRRLNEMPSDKFVLDRGAILKRFVYERFDGMVKQPKHSVLDALLDAEIQVFSKSLGFAVSDAMTQGVASVFNAMVLTENAGVNVELPYVLEKNGRRVFVHRVNANEGHAADKRKEFSSKIRSIRYKAVSGKLLERDDYYASILVIDGNWVKPGNEDPFGHIRMLTVAGWDFVVYPGGLSEAFKLLEKKMKKDGLA